jgi:hypothetical protein
MEWCTTSTVAGSRIVVGVIFGVIITRAITTTAVTYTTTAAI